MKQQPYEAAGLKAADVLKAIDVLVLLDLKDAVIDVLVAATTDGRGMVRMLREGGDEADESPTGRLVVARSK